MFYQILGKKKKKKKGLDVGIIIIFDGESDNLSFNKLKLEYNKEKKLQELKTSQISSKIKCSTQLGLTPFQNWDKPDSLAAFASSWATLLPSLFKCWNVHQLKEAEQL